jgi:hypothetical protein
VQRLPPSRLINAPVFFPWAGNPRPERDKKRRQAVKLTFIEAFLEWQRFSAL